MDNELKSSIDLLLVSDCVYYEQSLEPLVISKKAKPTNFGRELLQFLLQVNTMASLTHPTSTVLLSYERRPEKGFLTHHDILLLSLSAKSSSLFLGPIYEAFFPLLAKHFHSEQLCQSKSEHGNSVYLIKLTKILENK